MASLYHVLFTSAELRRSEFVSVDANLEESNCHRIGSHSEYQEGQEHVERGSCEVSLPEPLSCRRDEKSQSVFHFGGDQHRDA